MAHHAAHLPWQNLSSTFSLISKNAADHGRTNLYFQDQPGQSGQLDDFAKVFTETLDRASQTERAKYRQTYDAPALHDVVITPATERKIAQSLTQCRSNNPFKLQHECPQRIWRGLKVACTCPLTDAEKRASFFLESSRSCPQTCSSTNERHHDAVELVKMLILHNEMEPLFMLCSSPDFDLSQWWSFPYDIPQDYGWAEVMRSALMVYICLNVFYSKAETHGAKTRERNGVGNAGADYRDTTSYQRALFRCTAETKLDAYTYPHREFFGVPEGMYIANSHWSTDQQLGRTTLADRRQPGHGYVPTKGDVARVRRLVCKAGKLPAELGLQILGFAGYIPGRRIPVPDDPVHEDNVDELRTYLEYCWQLLIRCNLLMKSCGKNIDWYGEVALCIRDLWGDPDTTNWIEDGMDDWDEDFRDWPLDAVERHWYRFFTGYR